jgi:hypothetical protein
VANARGSRRYKRIVADLKESSREARARCARCGQEIDYDAPAWDPNSFQGGHKKSWSSHPELREDPANFQAEHALCNQDAGDSDEPPGIGITSEDW